MRWSIPATGLLLQAGTAAAHAGQQHNTTAENVGHQVGVSPDTVVLAGVLVFLGVTAALVYAAWRLERRSEAGEQR